MSRTRCSSASIATPKGRGLWQMDHFQRRHHMRLWRRNEQKGHPKTDDPKSEDARTDGPNVTVPTFHGVQLVDQAFVLEIGSGQLLDYAEGMSPHGAPRRAAMPDISETMRRGVTICLESSGCTAEAINFLAGSALSF
eukprot:2393999-Amphidinium_carterae.1